MLLCDFIAKCNRLKEAPRALERYRRALSPSVGGGLRYLIGNNVVSAAARRLVPL